MENNAGNTQQAKNLLAKALQDCPHSGILHAEAIFMEPRQQRNSRSLEALRKVPDDPALVTAVARLFYTEHKQEKGRNWIEKALKLDSDYGDAWAWYYRLETSEEKREEIVSRCVAADPHHGDKWQEIAKLPYNARRKTEEILKIVAASLV